jgi:cell division protein FtsB
MKFLQLFLLSFVTLNVYSQCQEVKQQMSLGIQSGIQVTIPEAEPKFIDKVWKKYTKEYGKLSKNKKADEEFIEGAVIQTINGKNPMNIYISTEKNQIVAFFDNGSGFINSTDYPNEAKSAIEFMTEFGHEVKREIIREELEKEESILKKNQKELEKLKKDNIDLHKDIENYKLKIKKAESDLVTNGKDQERSTATIESQTKIVESVVTKLNNVGKVEKK